MTLRRIHRITAGVLGLFILVHLSNHLALLVSPTAHLQVMEALRPFYRPLFIEIPLLAAFLFQIALGVRLALRRPWPRRNWPLAQRISGLILALFLLQHIIAAIATRVVYDSIDTNVYWAAAVVSAAPHIWYFVPYYFLGCLSLFVHLASHLHKRRPALALTTLGVGSVFSAFIVVSLIGPHDLPAPYIAYLENYWQLP